jgi:hypothetical protein
MQAGVSAVQSCSDCNKHLPLNRAATTLWSTIAIICFYCCF